MSATSEAPFCLAAAACCAPGIAGGAGVAGNPGTPAGTFGSPMGLRGIGTPGPDMFTGAAAPGTTRPRMRVNSLGPPAGPPAFGKAPAPPHAGGAVGIGAAGGGADG